MSPKLKFHLKWAVPLAVLILLVLFLFWQTPKAVSVTVSPEAFPKSTATSQTLLTFNLNIKSSVPIWSAYLKTLGTSTVPELEVSLTKRSQDDFVGSVEAPREWLGASQTITFGVYINGIKTSQLIRVAITDMPVVLPPDPGEAGKETLAGIDSDNDGVRDDLQREIVFMRPESDEARRVLRAMVKKQQEVITTEGDQEHFKGLMLSAAAFWDCYNYLSSGDLLGLNSIWHKVENTSSRQKIFEENDQKGKPYITSLHGSTEACSQPQVQGHY